jgi:hypothetical protein
MFSVFGKTMGFIFLVGLTTVGSVLLVSSRARHLAMKAVPNPGASSRYRSDTDGADRRLPHSRLSY